MSGHTPTPWTFECGGTVNYWIKAPNGNAIADILPGYPVSNPLQAGPNAAFIVRAVNAHDELVTALKALLATVQYSGDYTSAEHAHAEDMAETALAKATETNNA